MIMSYRDSCSLCYRSCRWCNTMAQVWLMVIQTWNDLHIANFFVTLRQVWNFWLWASKMPDNCRLAHSSLLHPNCYGALIRFQTWDLLHLGVLLFLGLQRVTWPYCIGSGSIEPKAWTKKTVRAFILFWNHSSVTWIINHENCFVKTIA